MPTKKSQKKRPKNQPSAPKQNKEITTHTLDATGKILGRLATEAAVLLRGKNKPGFRPYQVSGDKVIIINAAKIRLTGKKMTDKRYYRHSGYLGGLKLETLGELWRKNPAEVLRRAIKGMLPKNKLQTRFLKNLKIYNGEVNG
jgi:large subunit ribosomal protein L13